MFNFVFSAKFYQSISFFSFGQQALLAKTASQRRSSGGRREALGRRLHLVPRVRPRRGEPCSVVQSSGAIQNCRDSLQVCK